MARKPNAFVPGAKKINFWLPADLASDLHAYRSVRHNAPQTDVLCDALRHFIAHQEATMDAATLGKFNELRATGMGRILRLAPDSTPNDGDAGR